jgi:hypothetical protein
LPLDEFLERDNSSGRLADLRCWGFGMHVIKCDVPSTSALSRDLIDNSSFRDSWRAPLARPELGIVDIFFALFGHTPLWMKSLLIVRNAAARLVGLEAPTVAEIMKPRMRGHPGDLQRR